MLIFLCIIAVFIIIFKKKIHYWIIEDIKRSFNSKSIAVSPEESVHVMFAFVDHFEPGNGNAGLSQQISRVDAWIERYPELADKHKDSDGIFPQHTFFFPPHYDTHDHLKKIVRLCSWGYGEVEMHLHHDRLEPWPDDEASLRGKILNCIDAYSRYGVFCLPNGEKKYAFIHGDWALANSLNDGSHCGINNEISILAETGCYADFTFPVSNEAQPKMANTLFYGESRETCPKGYNRFWTPISVGNNIKKGLMFVQGVIGLRWKSRTHSFKPSIEQSNIDISDFPFASRIDYWVNKRIHVKGKPNWIFIKIHTHGAREVDFDTLLGNHCDNMFTYLENKYNDGKQYLLHYVSAREMFNIIKAVEDGKEGNPNDYRDYVVPRYVYLPDRNL